MRKPKLSFAVGAFLLLALWGKGCQSQLSIPEMPGPPYPDKFGNNRWGVKYDPLVHGRGRSEEAPQISIAYSPGERTIADEVPLSVSRYRSSKSKWNPGVKPVRSTSEKRGRPRRPGSSLSSYDTVKETPYTTLYTRKPLKPVDYLSYYNNRPESSVNSNLASIETFIGPRKRRSKFRPNNFERRGNKPAKIKRSYDTFGEDGARRPKGSLKSSYLSLLPTINNDSDDLDTQETKALQSDLFKPAPQISKKTTSLTRNFATTLSKLYNDYKPGGENSGSGLSTSSSSTSSKAVKPSYEPNTVDDDIGNAFSDDDLVDMRPPKQPVRLPPPRPPPKFRKGPPGKRQYSGGGRRPEPYRGSSPSRGPSYSSYPSPDLMDDDYSYSSSPGSFSSSGPPYDTIEYVDSPSYSSSSGGSGSFGGYSSSGPIRVSSYTISGPSSSSFSSSLDSFDLGPGSHGHPPPPPPPPLHLPPAPVSPLLASQPLAVASPLLTPTLVLSSGSGSSSKKKEKIKETTLIPINPKRKKPRFQHHPAVVIRELLGRSRNHGRRERDPAHLYRIREYPAPADGEKDESISKPSFSLNLPLAVSAPAIMPPPQYSYNPLVNTLSGGYYPPPPPPPPLYGGYPSPYAHPPPPPPPPNYTPIGPISASIMTLRDTLATVRRPIIYSLPPPLPPPPPPPSRSPPPSSPPTTHHSHTHHSSHDDTITASDIKKENVAGPRPRPGPITQHLQDWPRIFTAMGSSVDAVAGGIHAVRKEISKATGQTIAKGIMMSGSAVHEVSKGMAHVINKMSTI